MIYQNEKMYIGKSLNPTIQFKQHALNPSTKMIANVHSYKPLEKCFELTIVVSSYKKYFCDCKEKKLIYKFTNYSKQTWIQHIKGHLTLDTRY